METKRVTYDFAYKGSKLLEEDTIRTGLENIERLFAECEQELSAAGFGTCSYTSQAERNSELVENIMKLKLYVWSAHLEAYEKLDHPLHVDISNGAAQTLSEIKLDSFTTDNTIGMEEHVRIKKQDYSRIQKKVKDELTFADFLGLTDIEYEDGLPTLENVETIHEFASLFRKDYDIMKQSKDINTALQIFLEEGEYDHISYDEDQQFKSDLADLTIAKPVLESIFGTDMVTGKELTDLERVLNVGFAAVDVVSWGLAGKVFKAAGYTGKELLSKLGITIFADTMAGAAVQTVGHYSKESGLSATEAMLLGMLAGVIASKVTTNAMVGVDEVIEGGGASKIGYEYLDDQLGNLKDKVKINQYQSAESVNAWWEARGYKSPYKEKTVVQNITLTEDAKFVRVYDGVNSNLEGGWVMRAEDIKGLTPKEIQAKFALEYEPKFIGEVELKAGDTIRLGEVGPNFGFDGGGIQIDLQQQWIGDFTELGKIEEWR